MLRATVGVRERCCLLNDVLAKSISHHIAHGLIRHFLLPVPATAARLVVFGVPSVTLPLNPAYIPGLEYTKAYHRTFGSNQWYYSTTTTDRGVNIYSKYVLPVAQSCKALQAAVLNVQYAPLFNPYHPSIPALSTISEIKYNVMSLDLAYLQPEFMKIFMGLHGQSDPFKQLRDEGRMEEIDQQMNTSGVTSITCIFEIIGLSTGESLADTESLSGDTFFNQVLRIYKMFLVVKAIELHVQGSKEPYPTFEAKVHCPHFIDWGMPCNAPHIVDLMWHAHILHTRTYAAETETITTSNSIIHHNPQYWMPDGSKSQANFLKKAEALFRYQRDRKTSLIEALFFKQQTAKEVVDTSASILFEDWMSEVFDDEGCG